MKLNRKERRAMNKKGFSLIELIVVMAVMGILVLIAAPRYLGYTKDANVTAMQADAKTLSNAALQFEIRDAGNWPVETDVDGVVKVALDTDAAGTVEVIDAIKQAYAAVTGETDDAEITTAVENMTIGKFDKEKLKDLVKNTKNDATEYFLVTDGALAGEVFFSKNLAGSDGKLNNGVFTNIVD